MTFGKAENALRGVGDLLLGTIASKAITFFFLVIFVRLLSIEELAVLPLYYAVSGAGTLLFSFGIPATFVRLVPRLRVADAGKMHSLLFTGFSVVMSGVIVSAVLLLALEAQIKGLFFSELSEIVDFRLFAAAIVVGGWKTLMTFILRALQMYRGMAVFTASGDLLYRIFGLAGYFVGGVNGLLAGFLLGMLVPNIYFLWKVSGFIFSQRTWYPLKELLKESWPFYFESYLQYFKSQGDVLIVSALLGSRTLAIFFVAKRLYDLIMTVNSSIVQVIAPSLSQLLGQSLESAVNGYARMTALVPLVVIPLGLFCAASSYAFIDMVGGTEYADQAFIIAALFCGVTIVHSLVTLRTTAVFVFCQSFDRLKVTVSQFLVYLPALYLMVTQFGMTGAPFAQFAAYIVASLVAGWLLTGYIGKRRIGTLVWVVLCSASVSAAGLVMFQLYYYSLYMMPVYLLLSTAIFVLLVSFISSQAEMEELQGVLPLKLEKPFAYYMNFRAKLRQIRIFNWR